MDVSRGKFVVYFSREWLYGPEEVELSLYIVDNSAKCSSVSFKTQIRPPESEDKFGSLLL